MLILKKTQCKISLEKSLKIKIKEIDIVHNPIG